MEKNVLPQSSYYITCLQKVSKNQIKYWHKRMLPKLPIVPMRDNDLLGINLFPMTNI